MTGPDRTYPRYVTVAQAADLTGAQPRTIRRWISRGHLAVRSGPFGRLVELGAVERLAAERLDGEPRYSSRIFPGNNQATDTLTGPDRIGPDQDRGQDRTAIRNGPDGETLPQSEESLPQGRVSAEGFGELVALLREKDQTILELAGRCGFLQARVQDLERENRLLRAPAFAAHIPLDTWLDRVREYASTGDWDTPPDGLGLVRV